MNYPSFIKKGSTIGVVAPSAGIIDEEKKKLVGSAIENFKKKGFKVVLSPSVFNCENCVSGSAETRAKEFMDFYLDDSIDAIIAVAGGEFMQEILPFVDFEKLKNAKPKFFQGMSDNTNLTLTLTTLCDVATIYGDCFVHFGRKWHDVLKNQNNFLLGENKPVKNNKLYQIEDFKTFDDQKRIGYNCTQDVKWKILSGEKEVRFGGRLIGGCMDMIANLFGTRFDNLLEFCERYKDDGIVWFVESCDLSVCDQCRFWWKMRELGLLKYCKGIIIGRPMHTQTLKGVTYEFANFCNLKDLNIPVVIDCDFGHMHPSFHVVCGAMCEIRSFNGKGEIKYLLK